MRIVAWNVRRATARSPVWDYLLMLSPDLALLQEVGEVPDRLLLQFQCLQRPAVNRDGKPQRFRTAVLARGELGNTLRLRGASGWVDAELEHFSGNLVGYEASLRSGPKLAVVSVHGPAWPISRDRLEGVDTNGVRLTLQEQDIWVSDLLRAALRTQGVSPSEAWVVGGDFNLSETFDSWEGGPRGNREYLDGMADLGFVECLRECKGELTPTYRNTDRKTVKHQMDHLFVTDVLAKRLRSCAVGSEDEVFGFDLSDHLPIIADFDAGDSD